MEKVRKNIAGSNPRATIILSESPIMADSPERIRGQRVLVVEDGPRSPTGGCLLAPQQSPPANSERPKSWRRSRLQ